MDSLRKAQIEAIYNFGQYYYDDDDHKTRGILSMCCGSGKTRTFYEIMKFCINKEENFFIYTTSMIFLVKNTIKDIIYWSFIEKDNLDITILYKVSDISISKIIEDIKSEFKNKNISNSFDIFIKNKIKNDDLMLLDNNNIRSTLENKYYLHKKKILLITTYDSIQKIYENIDKINKQELEQENFLIPNLLILDEAHNLVSEDNNVKTAKFLVDDSELEIPRTEKYLFMTATPLKIIKRNSTSSYTDDSLSFSMHQTTLYGTVFYEYPFSEGIKDNIIVDFDTIFLSDINNDSLENELKYINNLEDDEQQYLYFTSAVKILIKAILQYNLQHILIFLSNQNKVKKFLEILNNKIEEDELNNFKTYKIISDDKKSDKDNSLKEFQQYDKNKIKILLSVSILNEGVDIPNCDSIFFAEERNSETVIVQNIGRALRKSKDPKFIKNKAYIILPTKIYQCGNDNDIYFGSKFKKIRDVITILKEPKDHNNPLYYKRTSKCKSKGFANRDDSEEINEKSMLVDEVVSVELDQELDKEHNGFILEDETKKELEQTANKLVDSFDIVSSNSKLSNLTYDKLKTMIQYNNIDALWKIKYFFENKKIPYEKPHNQYKYCWKCYGDLLFDSIFTYEEATEFIKKLNLTNISSSKEWIDYINEIINNALDCDEENINILDKDLIDGIIRIPYDPKTFYVDNWKEENGWSHFLNKDIGINLGIEILKSKPSSSSNANSNLQNLINHDKQKIKNIIINGWQSFEDYQTDLTQIKSFIKSTFNFECLIDIRFRCDKGNYGTAIINIKHPKLPNDIVPITINNIYKVCYDKKIYDNLNKFNKVDRDSGLYINNVEIRNIIDNLFKEVKDYFNDYKKSIVNT